MSVLLNTADPEVWALTIAACRSVNGADAPLKIQCSRCHKLLAIAGDTSFGYLFHSAWVVEKPLDFDVESNGVTLSRRQALKFRELINPVERSSGPPIVEQNRHGAIVLLAPTAPELDRPELMVRCADHGDVVLERSQVADALRRSLPVLRVVVGFPRLDYLMPTHDDAGEKRSQSETRRVGGSDVSLDEMRKLFGRP